MGRGFGRGAKSVAIVTHAQSKSAGKKLPRGLRGGRKQRRKEFVRRKEDEEDPNHMLKKKDDVKKGEAPAPLKSLTAQIASIDFQESLPGRGKKLRHLRKQIMSAVKDVRRRHVAKSTTLRRKQSGAMAEHYKEELEKRAKKRLGKN